MFHFNMQTQYVNFISTTQLVCPTDRPESAEVMLRKTPFEVRPALNLQSNNGLMMQAALDAARLERHTLSLIAAQCTAAQPSTSSDDSATASPAASVTTTSPAARVTSPVRVAATPENLYNTILDQDTPSLAALDW